MIVQKADLESQLKELQSRLSDEAGSAEQLEAKKRKLEQEMSDMKKEVEDRQTKILKAEAENKQKDNQVHQLQNEMAQQDESISKLRKEKPIPIKSLPNTPLNLIMNVGEMIEWWMHYNKNMNLYIVSIEFKTSEFGIKFSSDNLFSYFDYNKRKWIKCHRTMFNGGPSCYPI